MASLGLGLLFLLFVGPMLALPALFGWQFRRRAARVRVMEAMIGETATRVVYVLLGACVALIGGGFVVRGSWQLVDGNVPAAPVGVPPVQQGLALSTHAGSVATKNLRPPSATITFDTSYPARIAFSPDGTQLLCAARELACFDASTGIRLQSLSFAQIGLNEHLPEADRATASVAALATSRDGRSVLLSFRSGTRALPVVARWAWDAPDRCDSIALSNDCGQQVAISADGRHGLVFDADGRPASGEGVVVQRIDFDHGLAERLDLRGKFAGAAFLGDTRQAAFARADSVRVTVFDVAENRQVREIVKSSESPNAKLSTVSLSVASDGTWGVTCHRGHQNHVARLWNFTTGRVVSETRFDANLRVQGGFACPGRDVFATTGASDGAILFWNHVRPLGPTTRSSVALATDPQDRVGNSPYDEVRFSPDGKRLAAGKKGIFHIWDLVDES